MTLNVNIKAAKKCAFASIGMIQLAVISPLKHL